MDLSKYKGFLDALLTLCQEGAKLNDFDLDDKALLVVRQLFDAYVGPVKYTSLSSMASDIDTKALPPWLVQLLLELLSKWLVK